MFWQLKIFNWICTLSWPTKTRNYYNCDQNITILSIISCANVRNVIDRQSRVRLKPGLSWPCSYGSWIYNYIFNQCLLPLVLWVRISIRAMCTTLCDKVCQWLATGRWFSPDSPVSSTNKTDNHDITEILLKVALNTNKQTNKQTNNRLKPVSNWCHT